MQMLTGVSFKKGHGYTCACKRFMCQKREKSQYFIPFEESLVVFITALGTGRFLVVVFVHSSLQGDIFFCFHNLFWVTTRKGTHPFLLKTHQFLYTVQHCSTVFPLHRF